MENEKTNIEKILPWDNKFSNYVFDKTIEYENKCILVIRDYNCAEQLALTNKVLYITDNMELLKKFKDTVSCEDYGNDDFCEYFDEWKKTFEVEIEAKYKHGPKKGMNKTESILTLTKFIDIWIENHKDFFGGDMKFDLAIMNPPYDKNLHLKVIEKIIPVADKVVNISPSTWAAKHNINQPKGKYREIFNNKIEEFIFIPHRQMNDIFGLGNAIEDGSIIVFKNGGKFDIMNYGFSSDVEKSLFMKIKTVGNKNLLSLRQTGVGTKKYNINDNIICSPVYQWHSGKNCYDAVIKQEPKIIEDAIIFNSINEKQNFENSLKTIFMNWYHKTFIIPGDNKIVAYMFIMKDYTQPWTNKRFCDFFNITGYISDDTAEPNSEWEIILNTMKEFE